jgi:sugar phosphate permease
VLFGVTQWVEVARGFSALAAGLLLLPMTVVSGLAVPPISRRNLVRGPLIWAALACLAAGVLTLFLSCAAWLFLTVLVTILLGFAIGAASSNQLALYEQADPEALGTASGLMRSFGYLGSIASSAVIGIVFRQRVTDTDIVVIAVIMIGASIALLLVTALDRTLGKTAAG